MKKLFLLAVAVLACYRPQPSVGQIANEGLANQIVAARQRNSALMKQYSWNSRVELLKDGSVKDIRIDQVMYGPNGQLQRTLLNDDPSPLPRGFLRKRVAEKEKEKMEKYLKGLRDLLDQYTLPTGGKVIDFLSQATIQTPDGNGMLQISGNSVVIPDDILSMSVYAPTQQTRRMTITTFYEQDQVNVSATFKTLASGLTYVSFGEVNVPAKGLSLQVQNYDYINQNQ